VGVRVTVGVLEGVRLSVGVRLRVEVGGTKFAVRAVSAWILKVRGFSLPIREPLQPEKTKAPEAGRAVRWRLEPAA
jgi:hypothetical protein